MELQLRKLSNESVAENQDRVSSNEVCKISGWIYPPRSYRSTEILNHSCIYNLNDEVESYILKHILRMDKNRSPKLLLNYTHRGAGRSKTRWKDEVSWRRNRPQGLILKEEDVEEISIIDPLKLNSIFYPPGVVQAHSIGAGDAFSEGEAVGARS